MKTDTPSLETPQAARLRRRQLIRQLLERDKTPLAILFMAAVVVPDSTLFPLLCIVMLPAWLLLAGKPMMMAWRNDK